MVVAVVAVGGGAVGGGGGGGGGGRAGAGDLLAPVIAVGTAYYVKHSCCDHCQYCYAKTLYRFLRLLPVLSAPGKITVFVAFTIVIIALCAAAAAAPVPVLLLVLLVVVIGVSLVAVASLVDVDRIGFQFYPGP